MVSRLPEPYRGGQGRTAREVVEAGWGWGICVLIFLAIVGAAVIGSYVAEWLKGVGQ